MTLSGQFSAMDSEVSQTKPASPISTPCDQNWIAIELYDPGGNPVPGMTYEIRRESGAVVRGGQPVIRGTLNDAGYAREAHIPDPAECIIEFTGLAEGTQVEPVSDDFWSETAQG